MRKKAIAEMLRLDSEDMHVIAVSSSRYTKVSLQMCCLRQVVFLSSRIGLVGEYQPLVLWYLQLGVRVMRNGCCCSGGGSATKAFA